MTKGGKREGAGRPPAPQNKKGTRHNIYALPHVWEYLNRAGNVSEAIKKLAEEKMNQEQYGSVIFEGKKYILTEQATLSNRVFTGWWGDAKEGETYTAEYIAHSIGEDGIQYKVSWEFQVVKGEEPEDEGNYPWTDDHVTRITEQ